MKKKVREFLTFSVTRVSNQSLTTLPVTLFVIFMWKLFVFVRKKHYLCHEEIKLI